jgi:vanillate O-demethylase ferredoxin subunit
MTEPKAEAFARPVAQPSQPASFPVRIRQITAEATGIHSFELVDPHGADLPQVSAGSHIDVHLKGGIVRQYSLCNDPVERKRYVIAVLRDDAGRGGSKAVHEQLRVGGEITISSPRNNFPIAQHAVKHVLLAGGIGVTPLKAFVHALERGGADYEMHYCSKGPEHAAFQDQFASLEASGRLFYHFDGGVAGKGLDIAAVLARYEEGTHLYYCGPAGFMQACALAAAHWPAGTVHMEHFKAPVAEPAPAAAGIDPAAAGNGDGAFMMKIASTGQMLRVGESANIVDVLEDAGIWISTSCKSGLCGTCKVRFLAGDVDHRDFVLSDEEHLDQMTTCVSRCKGDTLVLDL